MRVITGKARGVVLKTPDGLQTRPTSDRVKEAMFSIIQFDIEGRRVLDMFCGCGQLGIEALSRGANRAVFVDFDKSASSTTISYLSPNFARAVPYASLVATFFTSAIILYLLSLQLLRQAL